MTPPRALIVDDDPEVLQVLDEFVKREGFDVTGAATLAQAREALEPDSPDILLVDIHLPDGSGLELLDGPQVRPAPEIVLITGDASVETAVDALRRGAADYLTKPLDFARLKMVLANLARMLEMKGEIGTLRTELRKMGRFGALIGSSPAMQRVYDLIGLVARSNVGVLITGETGTGKEMVAETIHSLSRRSKQPFVPVDCGAVSATLIESELFGHERGSFTGADRMHKGYFERANRGTLFLDEVTEMPAELQVKLLRVLESSTVMRVGGSESIKVDVRIVAATNRRPDEAVATGKLREDLLYRLNGFPIPLPPLRDRGDDIEALAEHFLAELNGPEGPIKDLTPAGRERLRAYAWPGNVRELKNAVQRAFILAGESPDIDLLAIRPTDATFSSNVTMPVGTPIAVAERMLIMATLDRFGGDKRKVASALQISLNTLYSRLHDYKTQH
jgi:two-component system, NtrC family, response regulator HydG